MIQDIPIELVGKILDQLDVISILRVSETNRSMHHVLSIPSLFVKIEFPNLQQHGLRLANLSDSKIAKWFESMKRMGGLASTKHVDISFSPLTNVSVVSILDSCPNLRSLRCDYIFEKPSSIFSLVLLRRNRNVLEWISCEANGVDQNSLLSLISPIRVEVPNCGCGSSVYKRYISHTIQRHPAAKVVLKCEKCVKINWCECGRLLCPVCVQTIAQDEKRKAVGCNCIVCDACMRRRRTKCYVCEDRVECDICHPCPGMRINAPPIDVERIAMILSRQNINL
jgi:hypothetical protein